MVFYIFLYNFKLLEKEVSKIESDLIKETEKLESLNSKLVK